MRRQSATDITPIEIRPWGERSFYATDPFGKPICFVDSMTLFTRSSDWPDAEPGRLLQGTFPSNGARETGIPVRFMRDAGRAG
jgi:hypothetical protein